MNTKSLEEQLAALEAYLGVLESRAKSQASRDPDDIFSSDEDFVLSPEMWKTMEKIEQVRKRITDLEKEIKGKEG